MKDKVYDQQLFAKRLKDLIEENKDTLLSLSQSIGLSHATLSRYANAKSHAKILAVKAIADKYGINPVWLMGADVEKYIENIVTDKDFAQRYKEFLFETGIIEKFDSPVTNKDLEEGSKVIKKLINIYKISKDV